MEPIDHQVDARHAQNQFEPYRNRYLIKQSDLVLIEPINAKNKNCRPKQVKDKKYNLKQYRLPKVSEPVFEEKLCVQDLFEREKHRDQYKDDMIEINSEQVFYCLHPY